MIGRYRLLPLAFGAAILATSAAAQDTAVIAEGRAVLEERCSRCHAIDRTGESPHAEAPAFRTLSERYPVSALQEALAEGIVTGHPDMPEFVAEPVQIAAIIAYLESIQTH
ncbi:c-type cytochrome [Aurantimonas aggregata]|uniref:C-type cytochrome n=1 Tax=Aurantimonas aggregata TaxID=2047720 RepID=A0A6L9MJR0_9HYPH|nr:cytochrome c [Aurantimonas aggregata]NDV87876.1 c-type cytochrome [Aurantimonas aggregata]